MRRCTSCLPALMPRYGTSAGTWISAFNSARAWPSWVKGRNISQAWSAGHVDRLRDVGADPAYRPAAAGQPNRRTEAAATAGVEDEAARGEIVAHRGGVTEAVALDLPGPHLGEGGGRIVGVALLPLVA